MAGPTLRSNHNVVFQCAFHVVWSPKYRRSVLMPPVDERLKTILAEVIGEHGAWLQALAVMPDHVHLLVGRSAVRRAPAGEGPEGALVACAAPGVPALARVGSRAVYLCRTGGWHLSNG